MKSAKYDRIGVTYNETRKADPKITAKVIELLEPVPNGKYLDVGCGTGNYTAKFVEAGLNFIGIDPSATMLEKADRNHPHIPWLKCDVESIVKINASYDGITAMVTTHHWPDVRAGFNAIYQKLKPGGKLVIFTASREQMSGYWLMEYFPQMMEKSIEQMPDLKVVHEALRDAGFSKIEDHPYEVPIDQQDLFMYSGKQRPMLYFDERVRSGISTFADLANADEVEAGLRQLQSDLDDGSWKEVSRKYKHDGGDYLFIVAERSID